MRRRRKMSDWYLTSIFKARVF